MMKLFASRKSILVLGFFGVLVAAFYGLSEFNRTSVDRTLEKTSMEISARELREQFVGAAVETTSSLLNEIIEVSGEVKSVQGKTVLLIPGVACGMEIPPHEGEIKAGEVIVLKGRLLGFDDLFNEVQMDFCVRVN